MLLFCKRALKKIYKRSISNVEVERSIHETSLDDPRNETKFFVGREVSRVSVLTRCFSVTSAEFARLDSDEDDIHMNTRQSSI